MKRGLLAVAVASSALFMLGAVPAVAATPTVHAVANASPTTLGVGPSTTISPDSVITTGFNCPKGFYTSCSYTDNHTNTNNVTIRWSGNASGSALLLSLSNNSGSFYCRTPITHATSYTKTCTGVPKGTLTVELIYYGSDNVAISDSYTI